MRKPLDFADAEDRKAWVRTPLGIVALLLCLVAFGLAVASRVDAVPTAVAAVGSVALVTAAIGLRSLSARWEAWKLAKQQQSPPPEGPSRRS